MARGEVDYDCVDIHGAGSVRKRPLFEAEPTTMTLLPKQICLFKSRSWEAQLLRECTVLPFHSTHAAFTA